MFSSKVCRNLAQAAVNGASSAFCGEAAKAAWKVVSGHGGASTIYIRTSSGNIYEADLSKPLIPRLREIPELQCKDFTGLRAQYYKRNSQVPITICGQQGWDMFHKHRLEDASHDGMVHVYDQERSFIQSVKKGGINTMSILSSITGQATSAVSIKAFVDAVTGKSQLDENKFLEAENILEDYGFEFDEEASAAIWQTGYKVDIFDQQVDGWVGLGLPASFGQALKLAKNAEVPTVTAQWHKRKAVVVPSEQQGAPPIIIPNVASYVSFKVVRHEDVAIATTALWSQAYGMPSGDHEKAKKAKGPRASRALQDYGMMSAKKFWAEEVPKLQLPDAPATS